ncbi:hypothetical protein T484DRAFT_1776830 [Baffinella frigidus]|nr:hypothetical protein T484DRAFT_1776830 [Cryptophyta sp. CCMP2293]
MALDLKVILQQQQQTTDETIEEKVSHIKQTAEKEVEAAKVQVQLAEAGTDAMTEKLARADVERQLALSNQEKAELEWESLRREAELELESLRREVDTLVAQEKADSDDLTPTPIATSNTAELELESLRREVDTLVAQEKADSEEQMRRWKREAEVAIVDRDKASKDAPQKMEAEVAIIDRDKALKEAAQKIKSMEHEMGRQKEAYENGAEREAYEMGAERVSCSKADTGANEANNEGIKEIMNSFASKIASHLELAGLGPGAGGGGMSEEDLAAVRQDVGIVKEDMHAR